MRTLVFSILSAMIFSGLAFAADSPIDPTRPYLVSSEFIYNEAPFPSCHASTIAETADGALVAAWFGGTRESAPDVGIWFARNENGRWGEVRLAASAEDAQGGIPCWNPVLYQWKDGPLVLYFKVSRTIPTWHGETLVSRDGGKTWGERSRLPEHFIGPVKNKPIQLADGTFLAGSSEEGKRSDDVADDYWRIHVERTPGFGQTWSRTEALNRPEDGEAIQPSILTYPDGRLQMICRTKNGKDGKLWQLWSDDGGATWSKMEPLPLPNPNSGIDAVTLADGRQLLVYNHSNSATGSRGILNLAISENGRDWSAVGILENTPKGEFSYPAIIQTRDGLVHITYTWRREKIRHVVVDPSKFQPIPMKDGVWPAE